LEKGLPGRARLVALDEVDELLGAFGQSRKNYTTG
jgi:hypothetical protein